MNVAIIVIIMKNCNDLQVHRIECMRVLESAGHLGCRLPKDEAA